MGNCPHCSKELTGYVTQEVLRERLAAKDTAAANLQAEVDRLKPLAEAGPLAQQWQGYATKLQALLDPVAEQALPFLELAYSQLPEADRPPMRDWLRSPAAQQHALIGPLVQQVLRAPPATPPAAAPPGAPPATPPAAAPPGAPPATPPAPPVPAQPPAGPHRRVSAAEIQAYFNSPAYRALPVAEQRKRAAELQQQLAQPAGGV